MELVPGFLLNHDRSLQVKCFSCRPSYSLRRNRRDFHLNCRTTVLALLIHRPRLTPCYWHFEIAVIGLQSMHYFRCLFAERHRESVQN